MAMVWTEQEILKLRGIRVENKLSAKEAVEILKRSAGGIERKAQNLGIGWGVNWSTTHAKKSADPKKSHKPTREQASARVHELHTKGATLHEIASVLRMSHAHIKTIMATLGITTFNVKGGTLPIEDQPARIKHRTALPAFDPVALQVLRDAGLPIEAP